MYDPSFRYKEIQVSRRLMAMGLKRPSGEFGAPNTRRIFVVVPDMIRKIKVVSY
jgi:hypothetical protein